MFTGLTRTSVAEEKQFNPRLTKPKDEFVELMNNLGLPYPKMIGEIEKVIRSFGVTATQKTQKYAHIDTKEKHSFFGQEPKKNSGL